jgi:hypothetical protein
LIQRVGEEEDWEDMFCEVQLCLLPKVEGIPRAEQFWPISITNSDYRIIMRYWTKWFADIAGEVLSAEQHVMFKERLIDEAVEVIHNWIMASVVGGESIGMLQTDFKKAYNFVNQEALVMVIEKLGSPRQAINVTKKVMMETNVDHSDKEGRRGGEE